MDSQAYGEVTLLVLCVLVASLASATETAMTSVGRLRVRHLVDEGSDAAVVLERLQQDPNRFLATVLVVNTVALILASFSTTLLAVRYMPASLGFLGQLLVSLCLSVLLLIFAEVTPKTIAIRQAERVALLAAGPVDGLASFLRPVDRKSTRLNSSHQIISYAVFCLKKKNRQSRNPYRPHNRPGHS